MGVLDALKAEVYSSESLKTYEIIRTTETLLNPYPTLSSFLEVMKKPGEESGRFQDKILLKLIEYIQKRQKGFSDVQVWIIYRFRPKLKLFQSKYPAINDNDLFWEMLEAIGRFRIDDNRRFIAERLMKNVENALKRICIKTPFKEGQLIIPIEEIKPFEEPFTSPIGFEDSAETDEKRLVTLMNNLGVSNKVQFILLKQLEGISLHRIARMLREKYDTVQKQLLREKQRLEKIHGKKSKKISQFVRFYIFRFTVL